MAKRENESNKLSDLIPKMLQENRLQKGIDQMTVREAWVQVMGPGVANYTEKVTLKDQVLLVKLNSSALRQELEYGKDKILKMMQESLDPIDVSKIRLS